MCSLCDGPSRRTVLTGGLALIAGAHAAAAQTRWGGTLQGACSFYPDDVIEKDLYTFADNAEAFEVVKRITTSVGLEPNFEVLQANVPNAAAVVRDGQRYILFSQLFIQQIVRATSTPWASLTIMAHEIGHHLNGHTLTAGGSRPPIELQADRFAGHAVKRLGGSLDDALACFRQMGAGGSETHPPRSARLEAVTRGWTEAAAPAAASKAPQPKAPAAPPAVLKRVKQDVSLGYLNVRSGPGADTTIVGRIPAGSSNVRLSDRCFKPADGSSRFPFCFVEWKDVSGWVSSGSLE